MDPLRAGELGIISVKGERISSDTKVFARFKALPMGCAHAVNICQHVVKFQISNLALPYDPFVSDYVEANSFKEPRVIVYVDNIATVGSCGALD